MLDFLDRIWIVHLKAVDDYYKRREEEKQRWEQFSQNCTHEILSSCTDIVEIIRGATNKQVGKRVPKELVDGVVQLPLYSFYLVLSKQNGITKEQSQLLQQFFSGFSIPYSMGDFVSGVYSDNNAKKCLMDLVGISEEKAGAFWVQFFKVLYRTDEDTTCISNMIDAFANITTLFAALSGKVEDFLYEIETQFLIAVKTQAVLCRALPDDQVDFYGDAPFVTHFEAFKEDLLRICRLTLDDKDETLNSEDFFTAFSLGIIYQIINKCERKTEDKISIMDDVLSYIDIDQTINTSDIFKDMQSIDPQGEANLAGIMDMFTSLKDGNPVGWILLSRLSGTYNLETGNNPVAVKEAVNFLLGMENYLIDRFPMSGFGKIATDYTAAVLKCINDDIDKNVTIVDEPTDNVSKEPLYKEEAITNSIQLPESDKGSGDRIYRIAKTESRFLKCPYCGKIIVCRKNEQYCSECYKTIDEEYIIGHRIYPISESVYYDLSQFASDENDSRRFCFLTKDTGFMLYPHTKDGVYEEDYFTDKFIVKNGRIVVNNSFFGGEFEKYGEYLFNASAIYKGNVPDKDCFDGYFEMSDIVKPLRFRANGTVQMLEGNSPNSPVSDEGTYLRENELIRTDTTELKTGKRNTMIWLVYKGFLCRDAFIHSNGLAKATDFAYKNRSIEEILKSIEE